MATPPTSRTPRPGCAKVECGSISKLPQTISRAASSRCNTTRVGRYFRASRGSFSVSPLLTSRCNPRARYMCNRSASCESCRELNASPTAMTTIKSAGTPAILASRARARLPAPDSLSQISRRSVSASRYRRSRANTASPRPGSIPKQCGACPTSPHFVPRESKMTQLTSSGRWVKAKPAR